MISPVNNSQSLEMESTIMKEIECFNIDLIALEIQLEISKLLRKYHRSKTRTLKNQTSKTFWVGQLSPKIGLKSQLDLCIVDLGLLANALESRHAHQFTLNALFIRQGEPVNDLSLEEIATFIYQQKSSVASIPFHLVRPEAARDGSECEQSFE